MNSPCVLGDNHSLHLPAGLVTLRVPKETAGEHFEGLQMLTSLLAPKGARSAKPLIEDLSAGESRPRIRPTGFTAKLTEN